MVVNCFLMSMRIRPMMLLLMGMIRNVSSRVVLFFAMGHMVVNLVMVWLPSSRCVPLLGVRDIGVG